MNDDITLRQTFNNVAALYNEMRPRYPDRVFSVLEEKTGLLPGAKIVEIGPGTGQATKPLAMRGYAITGVELGSDMAAVARRELQRFANVSIVTGAFEDVALPEDTFDLVLAATAFHWVSPEWRYRKPHRILKPGGYLAIIHTYHVSDEQGDLFFEVSKPVYERYGFNDKYADQPLPLAGNTAPSPVDEQLFRQIHFERFPLTIEYNTDRYIKLLNTYSNHLAATEQVRVSFFDELKHLIADQFNGVVRKYYCVTLTVAQKI